ncbi:hypothetical protein [Muricoccus aerilatus]|uniref:hypothetical protein n=1 Tax=Muricoccus aerilatus TaxID=452982 RepID=UPI0012EB2DBE|nr:hypothetical protein [Roseomonas aerilata]
MARWSVLLPGSLAAVLAGPVPSGLADPWKDESGNGRRERHYDRRSDRDYGRFRGDDRRRAEPRRGEASRCWEYERRRDYDRRRDDFSRDDHRRGALDALAEILGQLLGGR